MVEDEDQIPRIRFESELVGAETLRSALRRREREGGSVGLNLVLDGAIAPTHYSYWLIDKTSFSPASESVLERVTEQELRLLPPELIFDGALLPLGEHDGHMLVAMCDPADEDMLRDLTLVAGQTIEPYVLSVTRMVEVFEELMGRPWRINKDSIEDIDTLMPAEVRETLDQADSLTRALNDAYAAEETLFQLEIPEEDGPGTLIILSRSRRTAAAKLENASGPILTEAERPKIRGKERGESRHYLDPVEEGEAVLIERSRSHTIDNQPKIIIDMGPEPEEDEEPEPAASKVIQGSSSIIIDFAQLEEPEPEPEETSNKTAIGEFKLGALDDEEANPDDDWARLSDELDALDDLDDLWPFDLDEKPFEDKPHDAPTRKLKGDELANARAEAEKILTAGQSDQADDDELTSMEMEIVIGPTVGEANVVVEQSGVPLPKWFEPTAEPGSGSPVSAELREALHRLHTAKDHKETFNEFAHTLSRVYERTVVLRVEGEKAVVEACDSPRASRHTLQNHAPEVSVDQFPALIQLTDDSGECFHGRLPRAVYNQLSRPLAGGPALSAVICPVGMYGRVQLLLYADAGPGRECPREPQLWKLMRREVPRSVMRLLLLSKRRRRWEVKA